MITNGKTLDGRYIIREQIGSGGFGAVFRAEDIRFTGKNFVAVKQIQQTNPQVAKSFRREADLLYNLSHPNLPKVTNCFQEDGANFIVMDYISGADLAQSLSKGKRFSVKEVLEIADKVLDALEYLHSFTIFHRDIKPHNIKIDEKGRIFLLDFGTAKGNFDETTLTQQAGQSITGFTPFYAPLEQVLRVDPNSYLLLQSTGSPNLEVFLNKKTDERSDIYSLGATLYHLLTRLSPEKATSTFRAFSVWSGKPDPLPPVYELNGEVSTELAEIIHRSLALGPENRFQTAKEFRNALKSLQVGSVPTNNANSTTEKTLVLNTAEPILETQPSRQPFVAEESDLTSSKPFPQPESSGKSHFKSKALLFGGSAFLLFGFIVFIGLGIWLMLKNSTDNPPSEPAKLENPVPKNARALSYSLLVQKMRGGKKYQEPFESSGQEIFESGYQFQMRFTPPDSGFLYVFAEGLDNKNEKVFYLIFPFTVDENDGKADVSPNRQYKTGRNQFSGNPGTENFWVVWSKNKPEIVEKSRENAFQSEMGELNDKNLAKELRDYLNTNKDNKAAISKDTENKLTKVGFEGDSLVYLLQLEHR